MRSSLFAPGEAPHQGVPRWVWRHGLGKNKAFKAMASEAAVHWVQAFDDGLEHITPLIILFNEPPAALKKRLGGHNWYKARTSSLKDNVSRMNMKLLGGFTMDEAMDWPSGERRHAKTLIKRYSKAAILIGCRHAGPNHPVMDTIVLARDLENMGGVVDPSWGRKRLQREHDDQIMTRAETKSDPTPWARSYKTEIHGYTCTLLTSHRDLAIESATQKHCVHTYVERCRAGREIVFRIEGPERATAGFYRPDSYLQVKGRFNREVSKGTRLVAEAAVTKYLAHLRERERRREGMP